MIADMLSNKKLLEVQKINIYVVLITQSFFGCAKNNRLNSTHYFIMKIPNKIKL